MNIRRGFLALAAMILGVGFLGAFPQQAQASVVTCQPTDPTQSQYPYGQWTMRCGTVITPAEGQQMSTMVNSIPGQAKQELIRANNGNLPDANGRPRNGVRFFLFANPQDYIDSAASLGLTLVPFTPALDADDYVYSVVHYNANNIPNYVAVFKTNKVGRTFTNAIRNGTATGAARSADYLQGFIKNGGIQPPTNIRMSDTGSAWRIMFERQVDADFTALNTLLACKHPTTMALGLFSGYSDKGGVYICNGTNGNGTALSATYAGLNNRAVLNKAWPHIYPAAPASLGNSPAGYYSGFYAEIYAARAVSGAADTTTTGQTQDTYFSGSVNFACSRWFVQNIPNQGFLDSTALPAGCVNPTTIMTTKCRKLFFGQTGFFPYGNIFNCSGDATAQTFANNFRSLGARGAPESYTAIKATLTTGRLNEFVFTTSTDYVNAFNAAGVAIQTPQNGDAGETYASQGAIYSVMFKTISGSTFTPPISQLQEIASHELGHGVDAILGFSSQSASSGFDLAMRNDLLELDYIVVGTSDATSTRRLPCNTTPAYTGPFVGITDPVDGTPFCTSGALTNPARSRTSHINPKSSAKPYDNLTKARFCQVGSVPI